MTRAQVQGHLDAFLAMLDREQILKEELLRLKLHGNGDRHEDVADRRRQHDALIHEIDRLRTDEMLPVLDAVAAFVASRRCDRVH